MKPLNLPEHKRADNIVKAYQVLGGGDNPVSRLFALNYVTLGISLMVNVLLFRFNV